MRNPNCYICINWTTKRTEIPISNGIAWTNESICQKNKKLFQKVCNEFKEQIFKEVKKC